MEHIEEGSIRRQRLCPLPMTFSRELLATIRRTDETDRRTRVVGLWKMAIRRQGRRFVRPEVNPEASPDDSLRHKAIGVPAKMATRSCWAVPPGTRDYGTIRPDHVSVKEAVFPSTGFQRRHPPGTGDEIDGRGRGSDRSFGVAFAEIPDGRRFRGAPRWVRFCQRHDDHKDRIVPVARHFYDIGFPSRPRRNRAPGQGIPGDDSEGHEGRPHGGPDQRAGYPDHINTSGRKSSRDAYHIRRESAWCTTSLTRRPLSGAGS